MSARGNGSNYFPSGLAHGGTRLTGYLHGIFSGYRIKQIKTEVCCWSAVCCRYLVRAMTQVPGCWHLLPCRARSHTVRIRHQPCT